MSSERGKGEKHRGYQEDVNRVMQLWKVQFLWNGGGGDYEKNTSTGKNIWEIVGMGDAEKD